MGIYSAEIMQALDALEPLLRNLFIKILLKIEQAIPILKG
jgi:hypothetical protein